VSTHERTLDLIKLFYDAVMDDTLWPAALKGLTDLTNSQAASFWVLDGSDTPRLPTFISINFDEDSIKEYLEHMAPIDPTVQFLIAHPHQPIVHDALVISECEKDRHPYYEWHKRKIETHFRMVGQTPLATSVQAGVALHRTLKAGRYEPNDIDQFALLHSHLERALAIAFRLSTLGAMQQVNAEWLDRNPAAILFLDEHKRVVFSNHAAKTLESDRDGIKLGPGGITLMYKQDDEKLKKLISHALPHVTSPGISSGSAMRAIRPSGKRSYGIMVGPVSRSYPVLSAFRPAVCIVITDPDSKNPLPIKHLQTAFGLTESEARLAAQLGLGEDLRCASEKLKITYGTARTRLAEIFRKTETSRQGELIRVLLRTLVP
jgi:DNA-binding CsgD family transcriptional regulator